MHRYSSQPHPSPPSAFPAPASRPPMSKEPTKLVDLSASNVFKLVLIVLLGYVSLWVQVRLILWGRSSRV